MLYYVKLDESLDTLTIHEAKNIHQLNKAIKVSWTEIDSFLNGTGMPVEYIGNTGMPFPYIKKSGMMYYFSKYKEIIEKRNYSGMSKEVIDNLIKMNEYDPIVATSNRKRVCNG